jgi:hypothetical protein
MRSLTGNSLEVRAKLRATSNTTPNAMMARISRMRERCIEIMPDSKAEREQHAQVLVWHRGQCDGGGSPSSNC